MTSRFNENIFKSKSVENLITSRNHYVKRERSFDRFYDYFNHDNHLQSDSSQDICVLIDDRSDDSSIDKHMASGVPNTSRLNLANLKVLDQKINNLNNMLLEQRLLLRALKEDLIRSNVVSSTLTAIQRPDLLEDSVNSIDDGTKAVLDSKQFEGQNIHTNDLSNVIEISQINKNIEREIRRALVEFLQNDDLKEHIVSATAQSVRDAINTCFSTTFTDAYMPIMEQSHRRLLRHITKTLENAFNELEFGSASLFKSVHKILRVALNKHQVLLEDNKSENTFDCFQNMLQTVLKKELREWREKLQGILMPQLLMDMCDENSYAMEPFSPISPPQPADPERSIIDQLMKSAEIKKQINEGDINKSFEEALSSADLSLVMAACKAADLDKVFSPPCSLKQSVLLSLVQQLATDMVHDTQLKCRCLEEAIINLNASDHTTRMHLPLVVGEVRKHLTKFLQSFPSHFASRRITLIIMAANNLLK